MGLLIQNKVKENRIEISRICNFLKCTEEEVLKMYEANSIDTEMLLGWSKLLEYDFFRLYSQHLILYAPPAKIDIEKSIKNQKPQLPLFRKNIYTRQLIDFILEMIDTGEKNKTQIINEYKIPKTTLYKWIDKYKKQEE